MGPCEGPERAEGEGIMETDVKSSDWSGKELVGSISTSVFCAGAQRGPQRWGLRL